MKRPRIFAVLLATTLLPLFGVVSTTSPAGASSHTVLPLCSVGGPPCLVSASEDGTPRHADPNYSVYAETYTLDGGTYFHFIVDRTDGAPAFDLDPTKVWNVILNTGSTYPRQTFARGRDVTITRGGNATSGYTVEFEMYPIVVSYDGCTNTGDCSGSSAGNKEATGYLEGSTDDGGYADPDYRVALKGFDLATNADWVSTPLQMNFETRAIILDIGNTHFHADGVTPFIGHAQFRLPFAMLRNLYLVDDPASLTAAAFTVATGAGPAPTVTVAVGAGDVDVEMTNITFSTRRLRIVGDTRPGRPRDLDALRRASGAGVLDWRAARSRGSRVRGYKVVCRRDGHKVTKDVTETFARLTNLTTGRAYDCTVRAKSRAGLGRAATVRMPRR